jgi:hypothetical protein
MCPWVARAKGGGSVRPLCSAVFFQSSVTIDSCFYFFCWGDLFMTIGDRCHKLELLLKCCPDVIDLIDYFRLVYLGRVCHLGPAAWLRSRAATHLVCVVGSRFSPASTGQKNNLSHGSPGTPKISVSPGPGRVKRAGFDGGSWRATRVTSHRAEMREATAAVAATPRCESTGAGGRSLSPHRGGRARCGRPRRRPPPRQGAEVQVLEVPAGRESTTTRPSLTAAGFGGGACNDGVD